MWRVGTVTDITPEIKVNMSTNGKGYTWKEIRKLTQLELDNEKEQKRIKKEQKRECCLYVYTLTLKTSM